MEETGTHRVGRWWRVSLRAKGVADLAVPLAALFVALFAVFLVEDSVRSADGTMIRAYDIRAELVQLHRSLLDAEAAVASAQPGVAASEAARKEIGESQGRLAGEIAGDAEAMPALDEIRRLIASRIGAFDRLARGSALPADHDRTDTAGLEAQISRLNRYEEHRIAEVRERRDLARQNLFRTLILCGIFGPLGALLAHLILTGRMVRRLRTVEENAHRLAQGLPLGPPPSGTDEITALGRRIESAAQLLRERERELRESELRYRGLFDQAPVAYLETDREGVIRRFNQAVCTLLRCTPEHLTGRHAWDFLAPEEQQALRAAMLDRIARGAETGPFESEYLLDNGTGITVEIRENPIRNEAGEITGTVSSLMDVTERNLAKVAARKVEQYALELHVRNEQLAHALRGARSATIAKSRFLATVSHELRTPLNGIIGFSELLYDQKLGLLAAEQREVLGDILASSRHLLQLISDILDLSKVEAGRMEFWPERHCVRDLVFEVRDVLRSLAEKKGIALTVDCPVETVAYIDGARFKQVLYNYLSNALKFTPEGGSVTVRLAVEGDHFRLEVEDTGIGITDDEKPRLFQEFAQLPNSRKAEQGTGLGLALTRHIVEAQGGSVAVRSQPGRGSVFSARLPLQNAARATTT